MKALKAMTLALMIMTLWSCQQNADEPVVRPVPEVENLETEGIDPFATELSAIDAKFVAKAFATKQNCDSRSDFGKTVKSVIPITDANGLTAIYAVNFEDGYVLVSASKTTSPILANVEHGHFSLMDAPFGRDVVIDEYIDYINFSRKYADQTELKQLWIPYENTSVGEPATLSRAVDDDLLDARGEFVRELKNRGYTVYTNKDLFEELPRNIRDWANSCIEGRRNEFMEESGQNIDYGWILAIAPNSIIDANLHYS